MMFLRCEWYLVQSRDGRDAHSGPTTHPVPVVVTLDDYPTTHDPPHPTPPVRHDTLPVE